MGRLSLLVVGLLALAPAAWAEVNIPTCTKANEAQCGVQAGKTVLYRLTDGLLGNQCSTGGGSSSVICRCVGTTCSPAGGIEEADSVNNTTAADTACLGTMVAMAFNPDETATSGAPLFVSPRTSTTDTTETSVDDYLTPAVGLYVVSMSARVDVAPNNGGGTQTWTFTVRDDTADTTAVCTIDEAATTCSGTVSAAIAAGSKLTLSSVAANTPATAAEALVSFCLTPD